MPSVPLKVRRARRAGADFIGEQEATQAGRRMPAMRVSWEIGRGSPIAAWMTGGLSWLSLENSAIRIAPQGMKMKDWLLASAALVAAFTLPGQARADFVNVSFGAAGIYADLHMIVVPSDPQGPLTSQPNANYPVGSYIVTAISGIFTYAGGPVNISNAQITGIVPVTFETARDHPPADPANTLAPHSLSFLHLNPEPSIDGDLSYDNLYYPNGSPQTANGYPFSGGVLDIYGLAFTVAGGYTVNLWSDGENPDLGGLTYGMAVVSDNAVQDYTFAGISVVPEPASMLLLGTGLLGMAAARRRSRG